MAPSFVSFALLAGPVAAHVGTWNPGMYCRGGNDPAVDDQNTNLVVNPVYELDESEWWQQRDRGCHLVPPPEGEFLDLPAGGSFMTELANNRAFTTLSYDGAFVTEWQDGKNRSTPWTGPGSNPPGCLNENEDGLGGELHTRSIETAAGTAWAISYESDIDKVTMDNLVVFSVRYQYVPLRHGLFVDVSFDTDSVKAPLSSARLGTMCRRTCPSALRRDAIARGSGSPMDVSILLVCWVFFLRGQR